MDFSMDRISIPNPYFEGASNVYLLRERSLAVLIDTGIGTPEASALLQKELSALGCPLREISVVLLTHKHMDHFGLARAVVDASGAEVYVHQDDWKDVASYDERHEEISQLYLNAMRLWELPQEIILQMGAVRERFSELARSVPSAKPLQDGETLDFGALQVRLLHTPGHTQGSACFLIENRLFTGDHLLPTYTPNVGATDVTSGRMLKRFIDSLKKILSLPNVAHLEIHPGHGPSWRDPRLRIEKILKHHDERTEKILNILSDKKPYTAFEIAQRLFGTMREHHVLLGAGEVYAHLEELYAEGHVERLFPNFFQSR
ncbi:MBL fold metallo-hydrolase [Candidatus Acetothermia bacterium]|jgi:glyoxylase-like metal-dependent hydrolase (beta-lactamase superfamily II)|nr:MBL fold metallo-hydrolase [Candidatus Acetothermia bacterium]